MPKLTKILSLILYIFLGWYSPILLAQLFFAMMLYSCAIRLFRLSDRPQSAPEPEVKPEPETDAEYSAGYYKRMLNLKQFQTLKN